MELTNTQPTLDIHSPERAVFVTDDNRRARRLRYGSIVAAALACLWVIGLAVGMFGLGGLPGISLGKNDDPGARGVQQEPNSAKFSPLASPLDPRAAVATPSRQNERTLGSRSRSDRAPARPAGAVKPPVSIPPVSNPAPPAQQPVNPSGRERGWTRKGNQAPPGQVRQTQPPPPPGSQGQHRGQTQTTAKPPPPGQVKKTPPPPPPPEG
jgi:hypothetical protein